MKIHAYVPRKIKISDIIKLSRMCGVIIAFAEDALRRLGNAGINGAKAGKALREMLIKLKEKNEK